MKKLIQLSIVIMSALLIAKPVYAGFPNDLSDVVFIEAPYVKSWPVGSQLNVAVSGGTIFMPYDKANSWPSVRPSSLNGAAVNANAWGIINLGGVWHAGTWEYLRPGQTTKLVKAFGGCCHFRSPINNFNLVNGRDYGIFIAGVTRDTSGGINVAQRTNYVVYRWGQGTVFSETPGRSAPEPEPEDPPVIPAPAINLLLDDSKGGAKSI